MDHHGKNMVLTKTVWLLFGLTTAYASVLRTHPYPPADYYGPPSETYGPPNDYIKNFTSIVIPPAPELPLHVSTVVDQGSGNYEGYLGYENQATLTVIPQAPELPPFTSQVIVESKNQFDASNIALEPVVIPEAPVLPLVVVPQAQQTEKNCDCATEEVPQSPVEPFVLVVEDQSAIQDSVQSVVIPRAPELPPLVLPEIPKPAIIEERYPIPEAGVDVKPVYIPQAPELPPFVNTVQIPNEYIPAPCVHDSHVEINNAVVVPQPPKLPSLDFPDLPIIIEQTYPEIVEEVKPVYIPQPPELPPIVLPEFHPIEIVEDRVKEIYSVIPQAPELPPLVLSEIPQPVFEEKPAKTHPEQPCEVDVVVAEPIVELKPVVIPQAPELPPLVLPELPARVLEEKVIETRPYPPALPEQPCEVNVVVAEPIVEVQPVVIPQAPELPPLVLPELPARVLEEKVIETRPYPPALPEQPCEVDIVVAEPIVELKPVVIPQAPELPPLVLPELPARVLEEKVIETRPYPPALPEQPCEVDIVVAEPIVEVKPVVIPQAPELPPLVLPELPARVLEEKVIETRPYPPALPEQPCEVDIVVAEPIVEVKPVVIPQAPELPPLVLPELPARVLEEKVIETRPYPPALPEQPCEVDIVVAEPIVEVKPVVIPQAPELPPLVLPELPARVLEEKVIETRPYPPALPEQPCEVDVVVAEPIVEVKPVVIPQAPELPPLVVPELPARVFKKKVIETRPYPPALPLPTHTVNEEEFSKVNIIVPEVPKLPECVKNDVPIIIQERIVDRIVTVPSSKFGINFKPLESSYKPLNAVNLIQI